MNRIITILVTIFILLLLYIWISHVWGSDNPRHPNEIVDAQQNEMGDGLMADADTTYHGNGSAISNQNTEVNSDEFSTERKESGNEQQVKSTEVPTSGSETRKNEEPKIAEQKPQEPTQKVTTKNAPPKTISNPPASKPTTTSPAKSVSAPSTSGASADGKHLVIAGNFSQLVNAQQRVDELKRAGFKEAEVVNFDLSEYHTVCVGRFSDVNEARRLVKKLKDYHKIDAYVRIGS